MDLFTAKKLAALRKYNSLSQESLAEKIGVSRQAISKWERGEASPDTENLFTLSKIYSVSIDDLLGEKTAEQIISQAKEKESQKEAAEKAESKKEENTEAKTEKAVTSSQADNLYSNTAAKAEELKNRFLSETTDFAPLGKKLLRFPYVFIAVAAYLAIGFTLKIWHPTWLVFITIPIYYISAIGFLSKSKKKMLLLQPVYLWAVILFLIGGIIFHIWHPTWLIFLLIPAYYWVVLTSKNI